VIAVALSAAVPSGVFIMSPQVDAILAQIERLNEADRIALEQRLQDLAEAQWRREAADARAAASKQGINQPVIDDAIEGLRYGS
jgi:hypothetical protein